MDWNLIIPCYMVIGLGYLIVNVFVRKLETEDDYLLPFVWMFFWWVCFIALFIQYVGRKLKKF